MRFSLGQGPEILCLMRPAYYISLYLTSKHISFLTSHNIQLPLIKFVVSETPRSFCTGTTLISCLSINHGSTFIFY